MQYYLQYLLDLACVHCRKTHLCTSLSFSLFYLRSHQNSVGETADLRMVPAYVCGMFILVTLFAQRDNVYTGDPQRINIKHQI